MFFLKALSYKVSNAPKMANGTLKKYLFMKYLRLSERLED